MRDYDQLYGSAYLSAGDLKGEVVRYRIGKVVEADMRQRDGTTQAKWVILFRGVEKQLPLNKTNAKILVDAFGKDPDAWPGELIDLVVETTSFGDGIRVKPVKPVAKPKRDDFDDMGGDKVPF
jgi:hypothetical protein